MLLMACHVSATEYDNVMAHLNEEQRQLLNDYRKPTLEFNSHSLTRFNPVSLVSFQLTADTNPMNGAAFQLGAQYRSWAVHPDFNNLNYNTYSTEFTISSPLIKALDFTDAIREKTELCPEKLLDKMVFDGAFNLNFAW